MKKPATERFFFSSECSESSPRPRSEQRRELNQGFGPRTLSHNTAADLTTTVSKLWRYKNAPLIFLFIIRTKPPIKGFSIWKNKVNSTQSNEGWRSDEKQTDKNRKFQLWEKWGTRNRLDQRPAVSIYKLHKHFPRYQRDLRDSQGNNSLSAAIENAFKVCIWWNFWMELANANI